MSGDELKAMRKRAGLAQRELAARLGVALNTVWRWEAGQRSIDTRTELAIRYVLSDGPQRMASGSRRCGHKPRGGTADGRRIR